MPGLARIGGRGRERGPYWAVPPVVDDASVYELRGDGMLLAVAAARPRGAKPGASLRVTRTSPRAGAREQPATPVDIRLGC